MKPAFEAIIAKLQEEGYEVHDKGRIEYSKIFRIIESSFFFRNIPSVIPLSPPKFHSSAMPWLLWLQFMNRRVLDATIKIIKASLIVFGRSFFAVDQIRDAVVMHTSKERERLTNGVPFEKIQSMLWGLNLAMSEKVLEAWIKQFGEHLEHKNHIQCHEFLYLLTNALPREDYESRSAPSQQTRLVRHPRNGTYNIEQEMMQKWMTVESRIQTAMNQQFEPSYARFESKNFQTDKKTSKVAKAKDTGPKKLGAVEQFKLKIRDPELHAEMVEKLRELKQTLMYFRLNGGKEKQEFYETTNYQKAHDEMEARIKEIQSNLIYVKTYNSRFDTARSKQIIEDVGANTEIAQKKFFLTESIKGKSKRKPERNLGLSESNVKTNTVIGGTLAKGLNNSLSSQHNLKKKPTNFRVGSAQAKIGGNRMSLPQFSQSHTFLKVTLPLFPLFDVTGN